MQKLCLLVLSSKLEVKDIIQKHNLIIFTWKKSLSKIVFSSIKSKSVVKHYINSYFSFNLLGKLLFLLTVSVLFQDFCYFLFYS